MFIQGETNNSRKRIWILSQGLQKVVEIYLFGLITGHQYETKTGEFTQDDLSDDGIAILQYNISNDKCMYG